MNSKSAAILNQGNSSIFRHSTMGGISDYSEVEDEDPFYELYNCHKTTFLESKIHHPLRKYDNVDFAKEDLEDMIKS